MSFTMFFIPAAVLAALLAAALLIRGIRARSIGLLCCSAGILVLTGICISLVMEFITRI